MYIVNAWSASSHLALGQGADYFLALKGNQPAARAEMESFLVGSIARGDAHVDRFETLEKGPGRIERRLCHVSRERHAAENLATIRRIVNNILRMERVWGDPERPPRLKQLMRRAARFDDFRKSLLRVFCRTLNEEAQGAQEEK